MTGGCTGVILAGGRATRYGGAPKGLVEVGGQRIIDRVRAALEDAADDLLLIANDEAATGWLQDVRCAADVRTDAGSLGGIHAALVHASRAVLVVAWDMPFVTGSLLHDLRTLGQSADAAVPESGSKRGVEPLCAYYGAACLPAIERRLDEGDRRVVAFFDDVRVAYLDAARVARHGDPTRLFMNVNTPDDLALAEEHATTANGGRDRQEA